MPKTLRGSLHLGDPEAVITALPRLVTLLVQDLCVEHDRQTKELPSPRPSLQRLVLIDVSDVNRSVDDLSCLLGCFSDIKELILHNIPLNDARFPVQPVTELPSRPQVYSVVYEWSDCAATLCDGLIHISNLRTLQFVDIIRVY